MTFARGHHRALEEHRVAAGTIVLSHYDLERVSVRLDAQAIDAHAGLQIVHIAAAEFAFGRDDLGVLVDTAFEHHLFDAGCATDGHGVRGGPLDRACHAFTVFRVDV